MGSLVPPLSASNCIIRLGAGFLGEGVDVSLNSHVTFSKSCTAPSFKNLRLRPIQAYTPVVRAAPKFPAVAVPPPNTGLSSNFGSVVLSQLVTSQALTGPAGLKTLQTVV